jgi:lipopolysaccharide biosynthesis glycosyltransferase
MTQGNDATTFPSCGVLYVAFKDKFIREAIGSATSLKKVSPGLHVSLFCDADPKAACFDHARVVSITGWRCKVDYLPQSPYERTIYLDSDTKVVFPIEDVFETLDRFDLAACQDFARKRRTMAANIPAYAEIPYGFPEHNGGVIAYRRNEATRVFFEDWQRLYNENREATHGQDQPSFRIALWRNDLRILTLPPEFNVRNRTQQAKACSRAREPGNEALMHPRILHWHSVAKPGRSWLPRRKYQPSKY